MRPIPRSLLIHSGTIQSIEKKDAWGEEVLGEEVILSYVRLESSSKVVQDKNNQEVQFAASLLYDCANSLPQSVEFKEGQILGFNQKKYKIATIEFLYHEAKLHHIQIGLVRHAE